MADVNTEQEPSIEEILESIRQIISDDEGTEEEVQAEAPPKPEPVAEKPEPKKPEPKKAEAPKPIEDIDAATEDDIIDLVDIVDTSVEEEPEPVPVDLTPPVEETIESDLVLTGEDEDSLLSDNTANAATDAMAKLLAGNVAVERQVVGRPGNVTLEDMARELMRPLIKTWLDQNLPDVIERVVAKEVEKISRRALDK